MWICMNDAFVSIVEDFSDKNKVVVRARVGEDLVALFPDFKDDIIETHDSDYQFRLFLDREFVAMIVRNRIMGINYPNFKDSVKQSWRKTAYMKIWEIMFRVQYTNDVEKYVASKKN